MGQQASGAGLGAVLLVVHGQPRQYNRVPRAVRPAQHDDGVRDQLAQLHLRRLRALFSLSFFSHFSRGCMLALPDLKGNYVFVYVFARDIGRIADF